MRYLALTAVFVVGLGGCTVGKDYARPEVEMPQNWRVDYARAADVVNTAWWQQFNDPVLNSLVDDALRENLDVRIAAQRVEQFLKDKNYKIRLNYGAFPDRPYDSPGTWGDPAKINKILSMDTYKKA